MLLRLFQWRPKSGQQTHGNLQDIVAMLDTLGHPDLADEVTLYAQTAADTAIRVTVFGEYSVGKSTLINALIGRQLLAARLKPTTGVPTELRHGEDGVEIIYRDGRKQNASLAEAESFINLGIENRARNEVERIIITTRGGALHHGLVLIDTPGVLDEDMQTLRAQREVAAADIVLLVLRADHMLTATERRLSAGMLTKELGKPVVPVVNFLGLADAAEHGDLRAILESFTAGLITPFDRPWFEVDALPALRHRLNIEGAGAPQDDYFRLAGALSALAEDAGARVKRKTESRNRWRQSWHGRTTAINDGTMARLRSEADRLAEDRRQLAGRLEASLQRLKNNRAGEKSRAVAHINNYLSGQKRSIAGRLPVIANLKTSEQRQTAVAKAGRNLERALGEIDDNANAILASLAAETDVVLDPVSVRELSALEVPPDAAIEAAGDGAGGLGLLLLGGAALLAGGWVIAVPAAIAGWLLGKNLSGNTKELEDYRQALTEQIDAQLRKLPPILAAQFDARVDELSAAVETKINALRAVPPAHEELKLRKELASRLQRL